MNRQDSAVVVCVAAAAFLIVASITFGVWITDQVRPAPAESRYLSPDWLREPFEEVQPLSRRAEFPVEHQATGLTEEEAVQARLPAVIAEPELPEPPGEPGTFGTQIEFASSLKLARADAVKHKKLMLVLHVSGNFEDSCFT